MHGSHGLTLPANGQHLPRLYTHKQLWLLGENHFHHVDTASMSLTKEDLLAHSRYIRDSLVPRIAKERTVVSGKHAFDLTHLRAALEELHDSPMTIEILSFSRIEKALLKIIEAQGDGWPPDIVIKAKNLIARWEKSLGPLQRVRTDLWGTGGRLEGLAKPTEGIKADSTAQQVRMTLRLRSMELTRQQRCRKHLLGSWSEKAT